MSIMKKTFISNFEYQMNVTRQNNRITIYYLFIYQPTEMIGTEHFE